MVTNGDFTIVFLVFLCTAHIIFSFSSCRRAWRESLLPCAFGAMGGWPLLDDWMSPRMVFSCFFQERIADSFPQDPTSTWWLSGCWWNHESVRWAGNERWGISFRDPGSEPTSPWLPMHALRCLGSLGVVGIDDGVGAMNLRYFWDHPCRQNHFIVR